MFRRLVEHGTYVRTYSVHKDTIIHMYACVYRHTHTRTHTHAHAHTHTHTHTHTHSNTHTHTPHNYIIHMYVNTYYRQRKRRSLVPVRWSRLTRHMVKLSRHWRTPVRCGRERWRTCVRSVSLQSLCTMHHSHLHVCMYIGTST